MTNPFIIRVRGWHKNTCVNHPTFVSHFEDHVSSSHPVNMLLRWETVSPCFTMIAYS